MALLSKHSPSLVVELLEAGLLDILAFELLSQPPEGSAQNFDGWHSIGRDLNPLRTLLHFCQYPRISAAVKSAIDRLPKETLEALARNPIASRYWKPFSNDFFYYHFAVEILPQRAGRFCDSLEHHTKKHEEQTEIATQCSCAQTEDWEAFHRRECSRSRIRRIDRQLSGTWVSHRSRLFKLIHLQLLIAKAQFPALPPGPRIPSHFVIIDATAFPRQSFYMDISDSRRLEILEGMMEADTRVAAMVRRSVEDPTKLLAVISAGFGRRGVVTLALFSLPDLQLLNGYVRVGR
ncbi:hypothetical protein DFP72DRAFT_901682 [Ephemerocybe angulata]|uniref:Uncharacterized protein n=1 Tax=Ephemerocybe angulata TaxID=980116 RepID=A0A8H6M607_9AGAR|nr:hypothetical protein DFP72DRAFT_901682 [Tulosesus angulatus]